MSFSFTMLLLIVCFLSTKCAANYVTCTYGTFKIALLGSFALSSVAPLLVDFDNPNAGVAFLAGMLGAVALPPILLLSCRAFKLLVRAVQRQVNKILFARGRDPWIITWI
jgi:hypothetical protein